MFFNIFFCWFFKQKHVYGSADWKKYTMGREYNSLSYDAMTAHTAVVFARYMILSIESRELRDERSLGELFLYFTDEMADITWIQAFQFLLQMFRELLSDTCGLSEEVITDLIDSFMSALPAIFQAQLKTA